MFLNSNQKCFMIISLDFKIIFHNKSAQNFANVLSILFQTLKPQSRYTIKKLNFVSPRQVSEPYATKAIIILVLLSLFKNSL